MKRDHGANQNVDYQYAGKSTSTGRIDLNDLLERAHAEKKRDSRANFLILSGVVGIALIVVLILSI